MVAVLGISDSSKADLLAQLDRLGTNLLRIAPGQSFLGDRAVLPTRPGRCCAAARGVQRVAAIAGLGGPTVRRSPYVDAAETGGISVAAADPSLLAALGVTLRPRALPRPALARYPAVVLGAAAAARRSASTTPARGCGWAATGSAVVGILAPAHAGAGHRQRGADRLPGRPPAVRRRPQRRPACSCASTPTTSTACATLLGPTANPEHPEEVEVSRPSDALEAQAAAKTAFTSLFLGLGAVALLVGGVGIANVMVISVLERRGEIGLRRALGRDPAARRAAVPDRVAAARRRRRRRRDAARGGGHRGLRARPRAGPPRCPRSSWPAAWRRRAAGGVAGLYPALRAARLSPTEALRSALMKRSSTMNLSDLP